ncbi:MAG: SIMPL domain-containing protein [Actinomycetota bacterium]|nr:SIMPL domain-containing protein [Actinomycetota bacterium]
MPVLRMLALTLLFAVAGPALAEAQSVDLRRKVSVTGQSSTLVANDAARLTLGVQATRPTARGALQASSRQMQRVIGATEAAGVASADIRTQNISVSKLATRLRSGRTRNRGYRATQAIGVVVREIGRTGILVERAVGAGATRVSGPEFFVSDASRSYRDALGLAFDDAKAEAQVLADRAGARLGAVLSIEETTQTEPVPQASASAPASGAPARPAPPVQPGESRLDATVVVVFELVG